MIRTHATARRDTQFKKEEAEAVSGEELKACLGSPIRSLSDCIQCIFGIAKAVEEEFWLPFALRGVIYESAYSLCSLAESGKLSRQKAIEIAQQLEVCCLFYDDLLNRSNTLKLIAAFAGSIGAEKQWSFSS